MALVVRQPVRADTQVLPPSVPYITVARNEKLQRGNDASSDGEYSRKLIPTPRSQGVALFMFVNTWDYRIRGCAAPKSIIRLGECFFLGLARRRAESTR